MFQHAMNYWRLFDEATCQAAHPTYQHRVDDTGAHVYSKRHTCLCLEKCGCVTSGSGVAQTRTSCRVADERAYINR
jgi:hypothetical protein